MSCRHFVFQLASSIALVLASACGGSSAQSSPPAAHVSAAVGVTYASESDGRRTNIHLRPDGSVLWTQETYLAASDLWVLHELRWTVESHAVYAMSSAMYELTHQLHGAIGSRAGETSWRALRISGGDKVPLLRLGAEQPQVMGALEQALFKVLRVPDKEVGWKQGLRDAIAALPACHPAKGTPFRVTAVIDHDGKNYHESIDAPAHESCARSALSALRQAPNRGMVWQRPGPPSQNGGRLDVRRGRPTEVRAERSWLEVPQTYTHEDAPALPLYRLEIPSLPPRTPHFARLAQATPQRGDIVALEVDERVYEVVAVNRAHWRWRGIVGSDATARLTWQNWRWSPELNLIEVSLSTQLPPPTIESLFAEARSLRVNERANWFCGETTVRVHTDDELPEPAHPARSLATPACTRTRPVSARMRTLLDVERLARDLHVAAQPVVAALDECRARGLADAHATLELSSLTAEPKISTHDHGAGAQGLACARFAATQFRVPAALRELPAATRLRVVAKASAWDVDFIRGLAENARPPEAPSRAVYRTRW